MKNLALTQLKAIEDAVIQLKASLSDQQPPLSREMVLGLILDRCCLAGGVSVAEVRSSSRAQRHSAVRHVYMHRAREETSYTITEIGAFIGLSRPTVLHGLRRVRSLIEVKDKLICELLERAR